LSLSSLDGTFIDPSKRMVTAVTLEDPTGLAQAKEARHEKTAAAVQPAHAGAPAVVVARAQDAVAAAAVVVAADVQVEVAGVVVDK
jgi:hypothetical protein